MSGGNSETLADLVFNDAAGRFDIRITEALRMYLNGKSDAAVKRLEEMVPEYKTSEIGPYLALVAANSVAATDPANALKYFDWARLNAPGSIIEETALRRSVVLSIAAENYNKALDYSKRYARRYILSPYAGQFADVFVTLVVEHNKHVSHDKIEEVLGSMETSRQREVYLRIARKAALAGELDLTRFCAGKAKSLLDGKSENSAILADLYSGMADVPTAEVAQALKNLASLPNEKLTDRDRKLRNAATFLASEMTSEPVSNRLAQVDDATSSSVEKPQATGISTDDPSAAAPTGQAGAAAPLAGEKPPSEAAPATANDPASQVASSDPAKAADAAPDALDEFVASTREKLNLIDDMLKKVP
jgi:chemotaxis protein MotC